MLAELLGIPLLSAVVNALTERFRASVQAMLDEEVAARSSVFL